MLFRKTTTTRTFNESDRDTGFVYGTRTETTTYYTPTEAAQEAKAPVWMYNTAGIDTYTAPDGYVWVYDSVVATEVEHFHVISLYRDRTPDEFGLDSGSSVLDIFCAFLKSIGVEPFLEQTEELPVTQTVTDVVTETADTSPAPEPEPEPITETENFRLVDGEWEHKRNWQHGASLDPFLEGMPDELWDKFEFDIDPAGVRHYRRNQAFEKMMMGIHYACQDFGIDTPEQALIHPEAMAHIIDSRDRFIPMCY